MPRTKIVCTIGPASREAEVMRGLIRAGMSVARINFSHGDHAEHARNIALLRRSAEEEGQPVAILVDLQGPKFRIGALEDEQMLLQDGQEVVLTGQPDPGRPNEILLPHPELIHSMKPGNGVLIDDGLLEMEVERVAGERAWCRVVNGGILKSRKGLNLIGGDLHMPTVTPKDLQDLAFALQQDIDYVAQSFVRCDDDVLRLRQAMRDLGRVAPIIAKIEKAEAVENFDRILAVSDGIMVARGDLGVETSLARVPIYQKQIIARSNQVAEPVITATQMLDSMTWNPRPTRAEVSDVANAVLDGTDAVMLSGETAIGRDPVNVTRTMACIIGVAEENYPYDSWAREAGCLPATTVVDAISQTACEAADELGAAAIICPTHSGYTARVVARYRPGATIFATTPQTATLRQLSLVWGVQAHLIGQSDNTDDVLNQSIELAVDRLALKKGDRVVVTAGVPFGAQVTTNMVQIRDI